MTNTEFWKHIAASKGQANSAGERPAALRLILSDLEPEEIIEFAEQYSDQIIQAYTWKLWGAAYVIMGGCSDDSFDYFRDWLISEGQEVFELAPIEPESLSLLPKLDEPELEDMRYVAGDVYENKTGKQMLLKNETTNLIPQVKNGMRKQLLQYTPNWPIYMGRRT